MASSPTRLSTSLTGGTNEPASEIRRRQVEQRNSCERIELQEVHISQPENSSESEVNSCDETIELQEVHISQPQSSSTGESEENDFEQDNESETDNQQENAPTQLLEVAVVPPSSGEVKPSEDNLRSTIQSTNDGQSSNKCEGRSFPIFIVFITLLQYQIFTSFMSLNVFSYLVFHPFRRYEIWRYFTLVFIHGSPTHLRDNTIGQLLFGSMLEVDHHWKRVAIVYVGGTVFGTLISAVVRLWAFQVGASGAGFALIFANLPPIIMNWNEINCKWVQLIFQLAIIILMICGEIHGYVSEGLHSGTGHTNHLGGALGGLLFGFIVLKVVKPCAWKLKVQRVCTIIVVCLLPLLVISNIGVQVYLWFSAGDNLRTMDSTSDLWKRDCMGLEDEVNCISTSYLKRMLAKIKYEMTVQYKNETEALIGI